MLHKQTYKIYCTNLHIHIIVGGFRQNYDRLIFIGSFVGLNLFNDDWVTTTRVVLTIDNNYVFSYRFGTKLHFFFSIPYTQTAIIRNHTRESILRVELDRFSLKTGSRDRFICEKLYFFFIRHILQGLYYRISQKIQYNISVGRIKERLHDD